MSKTPLDKSLRYTMIEVIIFTALASACLLAGYDKLAIVPCILAAASLFLHIGRITGVNK